MADSSGSSAVQPQVKDRRPALVTDVTGHADEQVMTLGTGRKQEFVAPRLHLHNSLTRTPLPEGCVANRAPPDITPIPTLVSILTPMVILKQCYTR